MARGWFRAGWKSNLVSGVMAFDWKKFDVYEGLRVSAFALTPLIVGFVTHQQIPFLIVTLGALYISLATLPHSSDRPLFRILIAACFVNASALAVGTLIGSFGVLGVPLFGIGFFAAALLASKVEYTMLGMVVAVVFSVGLGLAGLAGKELQRLPGRRSACA